MLLLQDGLDSRSWSSAMERARPHCGGEERANERRTMVWMLCSNQTLSIEARRRGSERGFRFDTRCWTIGVRNLSFDAMTSFRGDCHACGVGGGVLSEFQIIRIWKFWHFLIFSIKNLRKQWIIQIPHVKLIKLQQQLSKQQQKITLKSLPQNKKKKKTQENDNLCANCGRCGALWFYCLFTPSPRPRIKFPVESHSQLSEQDWLRE